MLAILLPPFVSGHFLAFFVSEHALCFSSDEFIECITEEKERLASQREAEKEKELAALRPHGYMDPILRNMSRFTTAEHFHEKVDTLFQRLDVDGDGMLEYSELSDGLKAMKFTPPVTLTAEEYEILRSVSSCHCSYFPIDPCVSMRVSWAEYMLT